MSAKRKMVKRGQYKIYNVYNQSMQNYKNIYTKKCIYIKKSELKYIKIKSIPAKSAKIKR